MSDLGEVYDEAAGKWRRESAPFIPAAEYVRDPVLDLLSAQELADGGFSVGRSLAVPVVSGEDRSEDAQQRIMQTMMPTLRAALVAYEDAPEGFLRGEAARALAAAVDTFLTAMGAQG